jgi:uncharacterized protein YbaA (DUF1428 family)
MARYVDGFVIPIAKKDLNAYRRLARSGARMWKKHGAVAYAECAAEDLKTRWGTSFKKLCQLKRGETVVFSWIVYKSKADRKKVNEAVMKDPAMKKMMEKAMPFDAKRMSYGGFSVIVEF